MERDCTNCGWDAETSTCLQGHFRNWRCTIGDSKGEQIPIPNCHAWKEKEKCLCKSITFSLGMKDLFDIICKQCGEKIS